MKRVVLAVLMLLAVSAVAGCGDSGESVLVRQLLTDRQVDGYIARNHATGALAVTQVAADQVGSVLAGLNPGPLDEFRAFLDFPLASVPATARILSADLDLFVLPGSDLPPAGVPVRVELVAFPPPLFAAEFDSKVLPPLAVSIFIISRFDVGRHVCLDVTGLMTVALQYGLRNFQVRILEEYAVTTPGLIKIDDSTDGNSPLLRVLFS